LDQERARELLDRIGVLKHPCDLDLLVFFARHPRTLMGSEQLASLMGYGLTQTAASLELLLGAALLTRTQNPTRAARMYVFAASNNGWVPPLLEFAATRTGRLAMRQILAPMPNGRAGGLTSPGERATADARGARPYLIRRRSGV
jgi:hypothetical protein